MSDQTNMKRKQSPISLFWQELKKPSLLCLAIAAVLLAVQVLIMNLLLDPDYISQKPENTILVNATDNYTHAALLALENASPPKPGTLRVYLIGGSSIRESFYTDSKMSKLLSDKLGKPVELVNLATFDQTIVETLILADNVYLGPNTVLVLGCNPRILSGGPAQAQSYQCGGRLPFVAAKASARLEQATGVDECRSWVPAAYRERAYLSRYLEARFSFPFFKELRKYVTGKSKRFRSRPFFRFNRVEVYINHPFPDSVMPLSHKTEYAYRIRRNNLKKFKANHEYAFGILNDIVQQAQSKGVKVLLLQSPRSPISFAAYSAIMPLYEKSLDSLRQNHALPYIVFPRADYVEDDFYDLDHFNSKGRNEYVPYFIDSLAAYIQQNPKD